MQDSSVVIRLARAHTRRLSTRRRGFTLIELLVVVVIIGILASIALPSFVGAQDKARNSSVQGNINTFRMGLEQYATDNNGSYPVPSTTGMATASQGLLMNNYLPGNKIPKSPWAQNNQGSYINTSGIPAGSGANTAALVATSTPLEALQYQIGATGNVNATPAAVTDYGALSYDRDAASQTYLIYGTGKKGKAAVVAAASSNNGQ